MQNLKRILYKLVLTIGFFSIFSSCTEVRLISDYDEQTDKTVIAFQQKVSAYFVKIENEAGTPKGDYKNYCDFFSEAKVDLRTLKIRADAIDKNDKIQQQIAALTSMLDNLETAHKGGFSSAEVIKPLEQPFNSAFTAIIKLQLALKRGDKKDSKK